MIQTWIISVIREMSEGLRVNLRLLVLSLFI